MPMIDANTIAGASIIISISIIAVVIGVVVDIVVVAVPLSGGGERRHGQDVVVRNVFRII